LKTTVTVITEMDKNKPTKHSGNISIHGKHTTKVMWLE